MDFSMKDFKDILQIILSWPVFALAALFLIRGPLSNMVDRFSRSETGKLEIGNVKIELGNLAKNGQQAVDDMKKLNYLMAESRLLELEITNGAFGPMFSPNQSDRMETHIAELRKILDQSKVHA